MSAMSVEQRGGLVEEMLPVAANLAVLVHGEGGPEDIAQVLAGLDEGQKNALIVVLAGMVDPDRPVGKGLSWTAVTKNAALPMPAWLEQKPLRDHTTDTVNEMDAEFVDWAAVEKFMKGFRVEVTDADFLAAVKKGVAAGMSLPDVDLLRRWPPKTAENWVNRLRKRYRRAGREFPSLAPPSETPNFTEEQVVEMRTRAAGGATYLDIALAFSCNRETVAQICRGRRYRQFGGPVREGRREGGWQASREYMCGHGSDSLLARKSHPLGVAA